MASLTFSPPLTNRALLAVDQHRHSAKVVSRNFTNVARRQVYCHTKGWYYRDVVWFFDSERTFVFAPPPTRAFRFQLTRATITRVHGLQGIDRSYPAVRIQTPIYDNHMVLIVVNIARVNLVSVRLASNRGDPSRPNYILYSTY